MFLRYLREHAPRDWPSRFSSSLLEEQDSNPYAASLGRPTSSNEVNKLIAFIIFTIALDSHKDAFSVSLYLNQTYKAEGNRTNLSSYCLPVTLHPHLFLLRNL